MKHTDRRIHIVAGVLALALTLMASLALADPKDHDGDAPGIAPPDSHAYGKTLTEWLSTYWRWYLTGADPAQNMVGDVQLMPLPAGSYISGDGTPASPALYRGELDITIARGTPFVLPIFAWYWERYQGYPAVPDDIPMDNSISLAGAHPTFKIDGKVVLSDKTKAAYYVPTTPFDPIVTYSAPTSYGSIAALSFQGVGVVVRPLSVGRHVIHLYEPMIIPPGGYPPFDPSGFGQIYDNTWVITVVEPAHVVPPDKQYDHKDYAEWAAAWWQWGLTLPLEGHPFYGCPADCDAGQSGKVWFLAGGPTNCSCAVPEGKAVFFPLVNAECSSLEDPPFHGGTAAEQRECAKYWADHIVKTSLFCEIDGLPVKHLADYRFASPQISFTAPTPWAYGTVGGPGTSVGDGYYLLLEPLSKGVHTIHFGGTSHFDAGELGPDPVDFGVDTTYHLIVNPKHGEHDGGHEGGD